jgi:hypothetical protein
MKDRTLEEYHAKVVKKAFKRYGAAICTDTIKSSYKNGLKIKEAVRVVIHDSIYWDGWY